MPSSDVIPIVSVASSAAVAMAGVLATYFTGRASRAQERLLREREQRHTLELRYRDWGHGFAELRRRAYVDGLVLAQRLREVPGRPELTDDEHEARRRITAEIEVYGSDRGREAWRRLLRTLAAAESTEFEMSLDRFGAIAHEEAEHVGRLSGAGSEVDVRDDS